MLIIGKENKIRDNPAVLFMRYIISVLSVYLAFDIVYSVIMCINDIWSNFVFRDYTSIYSEQGFYQTEVSRMISQNPDNGNIVFWGVSSKIYLFGLWQAFTSFFGIFIMWKLIKSVFRLYMEVAERYFVLMVLCAFFPVAVATYTCNTTKNIFFSYLRMFFSQAFVMLANIAFMKFFLYVLFKGGWMASLTNYICALAFVRVVQRIDSYMMAMGLNVAQTGSGILGAIGGAGMGFANMIRSTNNARKNVGKALIGMGICSNNASMFNAGATAGFSGETLIRGLAPTDNSFENAISRYNNATSRGFAAAKESENASNAPSASAPTSGRVAEDAWLHKTLKDNAIPTTDISKLQKLGINPGSIVQVEKDPRTGAVSYNDERGSIATSFKGDMYYNPKRDQEMEYNATQAKFSQEYSTEMEPGQSMSEANAARIVYGMGDLNTDVSHVNMDTLRSLYAGDYDSLEALPASKREQSEMLKGGDNIDVVPYGMDSVGHSRIQFRGRYMDQMDAKADDFYVDMYNIAQHPETLKYQGQAGWHFVKQEKEGFMVHDSRHTADDRPSVVGKMSPNYQKPKPNLNNPENQINAEKPTTTPTTATPSGSNGSRPGENPYQSARTNNDSGPNLNPYQDVGANNDSGFVENLYQSARTDNGSGPSLNPYQDVRTNDGTGFVENLYQGARTNEQPNKEFEADRTPYREFSTSSSGDFESIKGSAPVINGTSDFAQAPESPEPAATVPEYTSFSSTTVNPAIVHQQENKSYESVDDAFERIYLSGGEKDPLSGQGKNRNKGAERYESSKKDKDHGDREKKPKQPREKRKERGSRRQNNKNISVDFDDY